MLDLKVERSKGIGKRQEAIGIMGLSHLWACPSVLANQLWEGMGRRSTDL